jgi:hypothetical protein
VGSGQQERNRNDLEAAQEHQRRRDQFRHVAVRLERPIGPASRPVVGVDDGEVVRSMQRLDDGEVVRSMQRLTSARRRVRAAI